MTTETAQGYQLSPQQRRLWLLQQNSLAYRVQRAILVVGELDADALKAALEKVVLRHEILRTTFDYLPGLKLPVQVVAESSAPALTEIDLSDFDLRRQESAVEEIFREQGATAFDLARGPIANLSLVRLAADRAVVLISLPAICGDIWTVDVLLSDLSRFYGEDKGATADVVQYAQFSEWQNELSTVEENEEIKQFWAGQCEDPELKLPFEEKVVAPSVYEPEVCFLEIGSEKVSRIAETARAYNSTAEGLLLACWQTLLWRLTSQNEIPISVHCDGRAYTEMHEGLGLYDRWPLIGCRLEESFGFAEVLSRATESLKDAYEWQEYFCWEEYPALKLDMENAASFPVGFDYYKWPQPLISRYAQFSVERQYCCTDRFKLRLSCVSKSDSTALEFHYDPSLYDAESIERLAGQFDSLLADILANPEAPIIGLEILSQAERNRLLVEWADTESYYPRDLTVAQLFERQVENTPAAVAVCFGEDKLTFDELNRKANRLAHYLRRHGAVSDSLVALCLERSTDMLVAVMGVFKAGAAYLPLDAGQPSQRLAFMLEDSAPLFVITQQRLLSMLPECRSKVICIDTDGEIELEGEDNLCLKQAPESLAYVIYTSGSSGKPKGVMIETQSVMNLIAGLQNAIYSQYAAPLRVSVNAPIAFDSSIKQIVQICSGHSLYIVPDEIRPDAARLISFLKENEIDVFDCTPSQLMLVLKAESDKTWPRVLLIGGEAIDAPTWKALRDEVDAASYNVYGPTECTVDATVCRIQGALAKPTIGRPIANTRIYILDSHLRPAPVGVAGELHIAGAGVGRGYLKRPDLTAEKFIPDAYSQEPGRRLYRTGDLARFSADGSIEFLGRIDTQVKVRGLRIETGEIEAALAEHSAVKQAVVVVREDAHEQKRLVAYLVADRKTRHTHHYRLPNGMTLAHLNKNETDYLYKEIFEQQSYLRCGISLPEGACVFDVGANIGLFTLFVSSRCPDAKIYAFEPLAPIFEALKVNASLYAGDAKLFQIGISDEEKTDTFTFYPRYSIMSGLAAYADAENEVSTVKTFLRNEQESGFAGASELIEYENEILEGRFDGELHQCRLRRISDVIREESIQRIDLLKVDTQRSELDVLKGIDEGDWEKIIQIVVEVHDVVTEDDKGRVALAAALLERHGYGITIEQDELLKGTDRHTLYAVRADAELKSSVSEGLKNDFQPQTIPPVSEPFSINGIRSFLRERLPEYMVPSAFVLLDHLPLNRNGKVDRQALPSPDQQPQEFDENFVAPGTPAEQLLSGIWEQVLGVARVGVNDNFFDLGGDSILSIQIIARANQSGLGLTPRQLFQNQTVAKLAAVATMKSPALAEQEEVTGPVELTPIQHRFFQQRLRDPQHFNQSVLFEVRRPLDANLLETALQQIVIHHDALRLRFIKDESAWRQINAGAEDQIRLERIDLSQLAVRHRAAAIETASAKLQASLDLSQGPIIRAAYFDLGEDAFARILLTIHHLAVDGVSWRILLEDLNTAYKNLYERGSAGLPPKTTSFKQWAERLQQHAQSQELLQEFDYWATRDWSNLVDLPVDYPGGFNTEADARVASASLTADETQALLKDVPSAFNTQINEVLLAALVRPFAQWAGDGLLAIEMEGHGREDLFDDIDISRTVGWFTSIFPVLLDSTRAQTPSDLIIHVKETLREIPNRGIGYGLLKYMCLDSSVADQLRTAPPVQVSFNYFGQFDQVISGDSPFRPAQESGGPVRSPRSNRRHLINLNAGVTGGCFWINWTYSADLHRAETIEMLALEFVNELRFLIAFCQSPEAGSYTPSDFPLARLDEQRLNRLLESVDFEME